MDKLKQKAKHHKLRSFFSSIFGMIAVFFIISSITVVWLNRTLIDNNTYVSTISPLVSKTNVQNLIADKLSDQLLSNSPISNVAQALLPSSDLTVSNDQTQLKNLVKPIIKTDVVGILNTQSFQSLWKNTNKTAHQQFIDQLNGKSNVLTLNLHPAIEGIVTELKNSQLSQVANHISVGSTAGILNIKGNKVTKLRSYYKFFQIGTISFVLIAVASLALSIWIAVNHRKVFDRLLLISGVLALFGAVILDIPSHLDFNKTNQVSSNGIKTIFTTLTHNLLLSDVIVGGVLILIVVCSKLLKYYSIRKKYDKQLQTTIDNA